MDSSSWDQVSHILEAKDFFDMNNKIIYSEIYDLASAGQVIDVVVLEDCLRSKGVLDKVGGIQYLGQLARKVPTSAHIKLMQILLKKNQL